jgi:endonuclease YncB( thermonuclease family)
MKYLLALTLLLVSTTGPALAETVKSVYDGDTLTLTSGEKIRLACIDAPEMRNTAKKKADKPAAIAARDYLTSLVKSAELKVERVQKDLYNRTVARVYTPDGKDVSLKMVESGHAVVFKGYEKPCDWAKKVR